jgi:hypothetical protein
MRVQTSSNGQAYSMGTVKNNLLELEQKENLVTSITSNDTLLIYIICSDPTFKNYIL